MRRQLVECLLTKVDDPDFVFLTGDLGFDALEPLAEKLGDRFINAGVAEQNMVSVAAGLAREGMKVWVYSIGPFLFSRAAEQIRNDVGLNNNPVCLVANGAGLLYGVQGPSHFSIDDLGSLNLVPNLLTLTPAFDSDLKPIVNRLFEEPRPTFIRLGRTSFEQDEQDLDKILGQRKLLSGEKGTLTCLGTIASDYISRLEKEPFQSRPSVWVATNIPREFEELNREFIQELLASPMNITVEENLGAGGFGMNLSYLLSQRVETRAISIEAFSLTGSVFETYGSQEYLKKFSGISPDRILAKF